MNKYESKLANPDVYSLNNITKTFLLGAVILNEQDQDKVISISTEERKVIKDYITNYNNATELLTEMSKLITTK